MNRKEFIRKVGRTGIWVGLTGGVLFLIKQNRIDYTCSVDGICQSCTKYAGCDLEKANKTRKK